MRDLKYNCHFLGVPVHPFKMWDEPENAVCDDGGYRLRDFRKSKNQFL